MTDDRYDLTTHDGKKVDRYTDYNLRLAEQRLGYPLTIVQGSYHKGVSASAGTHDGGGVVDLLPWDWDTKVRVLREVGFAAWHRPAIKGLWAEHIHAVLIGNERLAPLAAQQVMAYRNGRDGLKSNRPDKFWRPVLIANAAYSATPPAPKPVGHRLGVDYSFARPSPAKIKAAGYDAVGRYLSSYASKNITKAEASELHAAGLGIWLVWEQGARRAQGSLTDGAADARSALAQAEALGFPDECPIFFAVDFDATYPQVQRYLDGARAVVGDRAGVYGGYKITTAVRAAGVRYTWQTMGWSGGRIDTDANLFQRIHATVRHPVPDTDENLLQRDFPLWVKE